MAVFPDLDEAAPAQLLRWFSDRNGAANHYDDEELWLQELAVQIAESGPAGVRFLLASIPGAAEPKLRAILLGLSAVKNPASRRRTEICNIGRVFLRDPRPLIVAEAVDLLNHLACTDAHTDIVKLSGHSSPYVAGSVLRYLAQHFPEEAMPLLMEALTSKEPIVRQNAIDELDEMQYSPALPALKRLLRDKDRWVRQAARTAVRNLEEVGQSARRGNRRRTAART